MVCDGWKSDHCTNHARQLGTLPTAASVEDEEVQLDEAFERMEGFLQQAKDQGKRGRRLGKCAE